MHPILFETKTRHIALLVSLSIFCYFVFGAIKHILYKLCFNIAV